MFHTLTMDDRFRHALRKHRHVRALLESVRSCLLSVDEPKIREELRNRALCIFDWIRNRHPRRFRIPLILEFIDHGGFDYVLERLADTSRSNELWSRWNDGLYYFGGLMHSKWIRQSIRRVVAAQDGRMLKRFKNVRADETSSTDPWTQFESFLIRRYPKNELEGEWMVKGWRDRHRASAFCNNLHVSLFSALDVMQSTVLMRFFQALRHQPRS